jgi:hypothetical protein
MRDRIQVKIELNGKRYKGEIDTSGFFAWLLCAAAKNGKDPIQAMEGLMDIAAKNWDACDPTLSDMYFGLTPKQNRLEVS